MTFFTYPSLSINAAGLLHFIQSTDQLPTYEDIQNQFVLDDEEMASAIAEIYYCGFFNIDRNMTEAKYRISRGSVNES